MNSPRKTKFKENENNLSNKHISIENIYLES